MWITQNLILSINYILWNYIVHVIDTGGGIHPNLSGSVWPGVIIGDQSAYSGRYPGLRGVPHSHFNSWAGWCGKTPPSDAIFCILLWFIYLQKQNKCKTQSLFSTQNHNLRVKLLFTVIPGWLKCIKRCLLHSFILFCLGIQAWDYAMLCYELYYALAP